MLPETHRETRTVRVLLVEDDEDDFFITSDLLDEIQTARFDVDWADGYAAAFARLEAARYDVCLLDYRLGERSGLEVLCDLADAGYRLPVIMLTGQEDPEVDYEAMKSGATDYLVKSRLDSSLLDRSIRYALERRRGEEMLRRAHDELEARVAERTAELHAANEALRMEIDERKQVQDALVAARKAAERANRAKSDFLANMSHEIRTPMNGVIGMTGLLMGSGLTNEQLEYAETVHKSSEELLRIINDILDFSKIEAGEVQLEMIPFGLEALVEDATRVLASRAEEKRLELLGYVERDARLLVRGDPGKLRQIATNLLSNAIKFTSEGEVVLGTSSTRDASGRVLVRFEVSDTGIGIPDERLPRLFEPFTQADASTTRKYGGTGLGLAICRQLVDLMGGEIGAESEPGGGSTFWFTVPLEVAGEAAAPPALPTTLRVLAIDDNATTRRIIGRELSSLGMAVREAEDARSALEEMRRAAARGEPFDVVVMDLETSGEDGLRAAVEIARGSTARHTRLILMLPLGRRGEADEALRLGVEAILTKPVRWSELRERLVGPAPEIDVTARREAKPLAARLLSGTPAEGGEARAEILVVEDNAVNQKVATLTLQRLGYRVDLARDGLEALDALSRKRYAAVLMDVQMPRMDGYEATAEIRRSEGPLRTPIIAMTANALLDDRQDALDAGMDDHVSKPMRSEDLAHVLRRWVT